MQSYITFRDSPRLTGQDLPEYILSGGPGGAGHGHVLVIDVLWQGFRVADLSTTPDNNRQAACWILLINRNIDVIKQEENT